MKTLSQVAALALFVGVLVIGRELKCEKSKPVSLAVYPVSVRGGADKSLGPVMTSLLVYELSQSKQIRVIEESMLTEVLKHQGFAQSDLCDSTQCQVEIGNLLAVQKMVISDLIKMGDKYTLTMRVIDVATGTVEHTAKEERRGSPDELDQLAAGAALKLRVLYGESVVQAGGASGPGSVETAPPLRPKGFGTLNIQTEPPGAVIYLDAEQKGKTPATLSQVSAGAHSLSLIKEGYIPLIKEVQIKPDQTLMIKERLFMQTGSIAVTSEPEQALVYMDGKYSGTAPLTINNVTVGMHTLRADLENYNSLEKQVEVVFEQAAKVHFKLEGLPGKVLISSIPDGAEVVIDGKPAGRTLFTGSLLPGRHVIKVSKSEYLPEEKEVTIQPNKALSLNFSLKKFGEEYVAPSVPITSKPPKTRGGPMVYVPEGKFMMGCHPEDRGCQYEEKPFHEVFISAFYIDKFEVTNAQYQECVEAGKCRDNAKLKGLSDPLQPVVSVSWNDAGTYCEWVGKRLPTEAEWERAARGTDSLIYPWGYEFDGTKSNYCDKRCSEKFRDWRVDDGYEKTAPVGSFPGGQSPYGALDMAGNASEWVSDIFDENYYEASPKENPKGPESGVTRTRRGGSWANTSRYVRTSARDTTFASQKDNTTGFRCAADATR